MEALTIDCKNLTKIYKYSHVPPESRRNRLESLDEKVFMSFFLDWS